MAVSAKLVFTVLLAFALASSAAGTVYNVGGDEGWTFQSSNSTFYDDQFKNITLYAGDGLNFTFPIGVHSVLEVAPEAVANCDASSAFFSSSAPVTIFSTSPGTAAFICGFPSHCSLFGMHLVVTFVSPGSPSPSPSPSPEAGL